MEENLEDLRQFSPAPSPILKNPDGTYVHGKLDVANRLAESFASVSDGRYFWPYELSSDITNQLLV